MINKYKSELKVNGHTILKIKVRPSAAKTENAGILADGTIKINLKAQPEKGKANEELVKFLARAFKIDKNNVKIIKGAGSRNKLVKLTL